MPLIFSLTLPYPVNSVVCIPVMQATTDDVITHDMFAYYSAVHTVKYILFKEASHSLGAKKVS